MTGEQALIFAILGAALVLFVLDRWRYDVVALLALLAVVATGLVPPDKAFTGFSDPVVVTVAAVLVISNAIRVSGLIDLALRPLEPRLGGTGQQVTALVVLVAGFSAFMNNVGALAIFLPAAIQMARRRGQPPSALLMPLSFGSLLGGLITLIGTPPNLLISAVRQQFTGRGFEMFDFAPVGLGITAVGVVFLAFGWRLLPRDRRGRASPEDLFRIENYLTEARLPATSPMVGKTVADLEAASDGEVSVAAIIRETYRRFVPTGHWTLMADDVLVLEGDPHALKTAMDAARLELVGAGEDVGEDDHPPPSADEVGVVEAVVTENSAMVGCNLVQLGLRRRFGVSVLAVGRQGKRSTARLRRIKFQSGDVVVLHGRLTSLPEVLDALGCLPLAERNLRLGRPRQALRPAILLAVAVGLTVLEVVPIAIAFLGAVVAIALLHILTLKEIYDSVSWPVVVLLGAMIPVSEALRTTGGTDLLAGWLSTVAAPMPPPAALGMVLVVTMLITPILNNAATVLVMAPIAASLAVRLGLSLDPFLMAVAVGASCDFLTPIGHQSNTLVMGPGGYRFSDYWRLGLPLSVLVVAVGTPLIMAVWPLRG